MAVSGGSLVNGTIVVDDRQGSVANTYDEAGDVVTQLSNGGVDIQAQSFGYDVRGERLNYLRPLFPGTLF